MTNLCQLLITDMRVISCVQTQDIIVEASRCINIV